MSWPNMALRSRKAVSIYQIPAYEVLQGLHTGWGGAGEREATWRERRLYLLFYALFGSPFGPDSR